MNLGGHGSHTFAYPHIIWNSVSSVKTISMTIDYNITHLRPRRAVLVRFYCENGCELEEVYLATDQANSEDRLKAKGRHIRDRKQ